MAYPFPCPTPESCWERHPENFPRLIPARVRGGLPGSALKPEARSHLVLPAKPLLRGIF